MRYRIIKSRDIFDKKDIWKIQQRVMYFWWSTITRDFWDYIDVTFDSADEAKIELMKYVCMDYYDK